MEREMLAQYLMNLVPLVHKKLIKGFPDCSLSKQQMQLLFFISNKDGMPMTFYSEKMEVSKPNITVMADRLIDEGFVERAFDLHDRRVIILNVTAKGKDYLEERRKIIIGDLSKQLEMFEDKDINRLNELIVEMTEIFSKATSKE